jgi:AcrR family transcriptional regulator
MDDMADAVSAMETTSAEEAGQPSADDGAKRRQVLEGAREVFMSAGFDAGSMNDIARAAGVSKGTLYAYFESKVALFEALIREDRAHQPERSCMFPPDEPDPAKALAIYGRALVAHVTESDALTQARVVAFAAAKFPRLGQTFYEAGPLFGVLKLKDRLDAYVAAGTLAIDDTTLAARQFVDLCLGDILKRLLFMVVTSLSEEEIGLTVDSAVHMFMKTYAAPPRG